jgi:hypothetical protein
LKHDKGKKFLGGISSPYIQQRESKGKDLFDRKGLQCVPEISKNLLQKT